MTQTWVGFSLALVSALAVNWGYTWENDAADLLPPVSARRPAAAARTLLGSRAWRIGFLLETSGWTVFDESLPDGAYKALQIAAFASIVLSAVLLGGRRASDEMLRE